MTPTAAAQIPVTIHRTFFICSLLLGRVTNSWVVGCRSSALGWVPGTGYTLLMDSVRFGRVLGIGTRLAAKTVASAIDAAKAPNPAGGTTQAAAASPSSALKERVAPVQPAAQTPRARVQVREAANIASKTGRGLKEGGRRFGEAVWGPFARLSGVLWLEFTGVFFGLFAVTAGAGAWKLWNGWHGVSATHDPRGAFFVAVGMTALFGYFCVSSFVRASHRGRQR
jgi:hypothetical protein